MSVDKSNHKEEYTVVHEHDNGVKANVALRAVVLFLLGAFLAFVLNLLQMEYRVHTLLAFFQLNWWVLPVCGFAASMFNLIRL